jgi:hypothetical protein
MDLEPEHEMELDWQPPFTTSTIGPAEERKTDG